MADNAKGDEVKQESPPILVETNEATIARMHRGATVVPDTPAILRIEGPGAVSCLQGLLTNDVDTPGPGSLVYGALLTPKGMIILDLWALRDAEGLTLVLPLDARTTALDLFRRTLPPRLATCTDRSEAWSAAWLLGGRTGEALATAGFGPAPTAGQAVIRTLDDTPLQVAGGTEPSWFRAVIVGPNEAVASAVRNLSAAGAIEGDGDDSHLARVLAGWPALGAEIGEKTLPQEVRFDEIGGVSYTKGCYTGQETVARVHFRGHPNRALRGLVWSGDGEWSGTAVRRGDKDVGQVTSVVVTNARRLGLAVIRREVEPDEAVAAGGLPAVVIALPFPPDPQSA